MYLFNCDYLEGAHPNIMQALTAANFEQSIGYGEDAHCENAARLILEKCGNPAVHVHFLVGGTQANTTVIASLLRPYEGVLSAETGHINVHETGAIESAGHKVLALAGTLGKISARQVEEAVLLQGNDEHIVKPGMVYISHPTEFGTLYTKAELTTLYAVCQKNALPLFIDGARLGYGLSASETDLALPDICALCDIFTIGGTKVGALFGEAVVIKSDSHNHNFRYMIKQRGGMLAKGRLLGIQFETLMADGLYEKIAAHAISLAEKINATLKEKGIPLLIDSPTNQLFPIFTSAQLRQLEKRFAFAVWEKLSDGLTAVRICTSWATDEKMVQSLIQEILSL
jgi:Threonine aldolase